MSWMTKEDEIKILGMENHNLKKEIGKLKADLKREQDSVDFYANRENWLSLGFDYGYGKINVSDREDLSEGDYVEEYGGKLARLTQQQRREG